MLSRQRSRFLVLAAFALALTGRANAWNETGHRVIASIAYRQLDEPTRKRVSALLRKHPAYAELWKNRATNGPNEELNLFWSASLFPDEARRPPWDKYSHPTEHYVNYRILAEEGNRVASPVTGDNVLNSYVANLRSLTDLPVPEEGRAVALSWIFHQLGDIHQPLHSVARFSKAFPEGDRGGNLVKIKNPRATADWGGNLHSHWDDLVGTDIAPDAIERLADGLIAEYPVTAFKAEIKKTSIESWAEESVALSLRTVYNNLDPKITEFPEAPVGYQADAERAARRRVALAGYRLGEELRRLFTKANTTP